MRSQTLVLPRPHPRALLPFALLTALVVLATLLTARSAQAQAARTITFNEAVQIALDNNNALERAANAIELSAIAADRQYWDFYPNLSFSTSGRQSYGRTFSQEDLNFVNETTESISLGANTNINVFNGFADVAGLRQSRLNLEASEFDFERTRQTVVFNVMSTFLNLIEQQEQIRVREENLESNQQQLEQIEAFVEVGARPISDLYQQQAAVANAELQLIEAQRLVQNTEALLIQLLQLDPFGNYLFAAPEMADGEVPTPQRYELSNLLTNAYDHRADLRAYELDIRAAREGIRIARSSYWPSLSITGNYGTGWNSRYFDQSATFFDQFNEQRGGSIGLSLSLPIFDRFSTRHSTQEAEVRLNNAELALEDLQQEVAVQVRQAVLNYRSSLASLDATQAQVRFAEQALQAAEERYEVGAGTLVEVAQQRAAYVQAASDLVRSRYDVIFRQKLVDYYLGTLDPSEPLFD